MPRGRPKKKVTEPFKLVDDQYNAPKCQNDTLENDTLGENDTLENVEGTTENNSKIRIGQNVKSPKENENEPKIKLRGFVLSSIKLNSTGLAEITSDGRRNP